MKTRIVFTGLSLLAVVVSSNVDLVLGLVVGVILLVPQEMIKRADERVLANKWRKVRNKEAELFWRKVDLERDKRIGKFMEEDLWRGEKNGIKY